MGRPVIADNARPVDGEAHRQVLDGDIMHQLVIAALQEGGIDRREGLHPIGRKTGCKGHRMLLGDADIDASIGESFAEG